jgi:2-dehydropantoate 2-reductase
MQLKLQEQSHLVFGAGLIGCYLGGVLSARGLNVQLVCRPSIQQKLLDGMQLSDYLGHKTTISTSSLFTQETRQNYAFIWLTVKCTGITPALLDMQAHVGPQTVILCCQNGLGSEDLVKQHFPNNLILRVMVPFNVVELKAGHFHRGSQGQLTIESTTEDEQLVLSLVDMLNGELLPVTSCKQMSALLWAKLQLNLGNCVNALADIPVKAMLEQRDYRLVIAKLMQELLLVTQALGIALPRVTSVPASWIPSILRLPNFLFKRVANSMLAIDPNVRTSMWWDVSQGKATEIDYLNGVIVEQGQRLNIACPANYTLVQIIKALNDQTQQIANRPPIAASKLLNLLNNTHN